MTPAGTLKGAVYVNGTITPADRAVIPVYDHGFVYGEGVYETLRTYNRVPFLYEQHCRRLRASGERLHALVLVNRRAEGRGTPRSSAAGTSAGTRQCP